MVVVLAAEWLNASAIRSCGTSQALDRFPEDDRGRCVPPAAGLTLMTIDFFVYASVRCFSMNTFASGSCRMLARSAPPNSARWQSTSSGRAIPPKSSWRLRRKYIFPILLFSAVSSLAINVRNAKDDLRLLEDQHAAQLSVLKDLINRMVVGETITPPQLLKEYERVGIVKRKDDLEGKPSQHITWQETIFGRKKQERDLETERQELADIEHGQFLSDITINFDSC